MSGPKEAASELEEGGLVRARRRWGWGSPWLHAKRWMTSLLAILVLVPIVLVNLVPIVFVVFSSFKTSTDFIRNPAGIPTEWSIEGYVTLVRDRPFLQQALNTVVVAAATVVLTIAVAVPAAYAYARLKFRASSGLFYFTTALMAVPVVVMLIPLFALMSRLGLIDRYPSVVIVYVGICVPFSVYVLVVFFMSLPGSLLDAARVDGASHLRIIWHIVLPLAKAPLVTLSLVNGLWVWNELLIAMLFLQSEKSSTLIASIARGMSRDSRNVPLIMAGCALASIPAIAGVVFGQRFFVRGFLGGYSNE